MSVLGQQAREEAVMNAKAPTVVAEKDAKRLLQATKASNVSTVLFDTHVHLNMEALQCRQGWHLSDEYLDECEENRANAGAHSRSVHIGGYDLKFVGRAVPSWRRGL
jgi:hypothetical protein